MPWPIRRTSCLELLWRSDGKPGNLWPRSRQKSIETTMTAQVCPACGEPLSDAALRGNCPRCLLSLAATPVPDEVGSAASLLLEAGNTFERSTLNNQRPGQSAAVGPSGTAPLRYFGDYE